MQSKKRETIRLFVSIPLDTQLEKAFSQYRDRYGRVKYLRWVPERNFHLTAVFIGETREEFVDDIGIAISRVAETTEPLVLQFEKIAYAPPEKAASMVWAYFAHSDALVDAVARMTDALSELAPVDPPGEPGKRKKLVPHVTLARFRTDVAEPRELHKLKPSGLEGGTMTAEKIQLMRSKPHPHGSEYIVLDEYRFKG